MTKENTEKSKIPVVSEYLQKVLPIKADDGFFAVQKAYIQFILSDKKPIGKTKEEVSAAYFDYVNECIQSSLKIPKYWVEKLRINDDADYKKFITAFVSFYTNIDHGVKNLELSLSQDRENKVTCKEKLSKIVTLKHDRQDCWQRFQYMMFNQCKDISILNNLLSKVSVYGYLQLILKQEIGEITNEKNQGFLLNMIQMLDVLEAYKQRCFCSLTKSENAEILEQEIMKGCVKLFYHISQHPDEELTSENIESSVSGTITSYDNLAAGKSQECCSYLTEIIKLIRSIIVCFFSVATFGIPFFCGNRRFNALAKGVPLSQEIANEIKQTISELSGEVALRDNFFEIKYNM